MLRTRSVRTCGVLIVILLLIGVLSHGVAGAAIQRNGRTLAEALARNGALRQIEAAATLIAEKAGQSSQEGELALRAALDSYGQRAVAGDGASSPTQEAVMAAGDRVLTAAATGALGLSELADELTAVAHRAMAAESDMFLESMAGSHRTVWAWHLAGMLSLITAILLVVSLGWYLTRTAETALRERRETELAFRESEARFRVAAEGALVGIYIIQDGRFRYVNPALARLLGYSASELINSVRLSDVIDPADWPLVKERMRQRLAGILSDEPTTAHGLTRDGRRFTFESRAQGLVFEGRAAIIGTLVDITERTMAEQEISRLLKAVSRHRTELQKLSARLIATREAERQWISQELHDGMGQALTAVSIDLVRIRHSLPEEVLMTVEDRLAEAESLVADTLRQMRGLSLELRPTMLDDLGLVPTLRWYVSQFGKRTGMEVSLKASGLEERLNAEMETALYRIVQEGLTNIARHASATHADVAVVRTRRQIQLTIRDNGRGFQRTDGPSEGMGLLGIRERANALAGSLMIESTPGCGTRLELTFPCNPAVDDAPAGPSRVFPIVKVNLEAE